MQPDATGPNLSEQLLESLDHEVILLSAEGEILKLNAAARVTLGRRAPGASLSEVAQLKGGVNVQRRAMGSSGFIPVNLALKKDGREIKMRGRGLQDAESGQVHLLLVGDQRRDRGFARIKTVVDDLNEEVERRMRLQLQLQTALDNEKHLRTELVHRVKNNLALLVSMIKVRGDDDQPGVDEALTAIRERIIAIAAVHDLLDQSGEIDWLDAADLIVTLCEAFDRSLAPDTIEISAQLDPVRLHVREAIPVALLVNELMTNALKHAFAGRSKGRIRVEMVNRDGLVEISVADNGCGIEEKARTGSGHKLAGAFARQVHGRLDQTSGEEGTCWRLAFRPRSAP